MGGITWEITYPSILLFPIFFARLIQAFRIVFPRVNNQKLVLERTINSPEGPEMVEATASNVLDIFKTELIVSHYINTCFWSLGRLIVFPPVCFLFKEFVKCVLPGCVPESVFLNTDSVSAGPYTDTLCLISWLSVVIGPLVLGNLFRGNQRVRNSHPVSLFHFVDEGPER